MKTFLALALLSAPLAAIDPRCPQPAGLFSSSVVSGANVVCLVDVPTPTSYALWAVPAVGAPVRLSQTMPDNRDVIAFHVSADRVAYTADPNAWTQYELFSVPISGGSPVKLSGSMPSDNDVDDFAFSGDEKRVVYRKGRNATGVWELFSAPSNEFGGPPNKLISQPGIAAVQRGFIVSGNVVRFSQDPSGSGVPTWYSVTVLGGAEIFTDGFESGTTGGWR